MKTLWKTITWPFRHLHLILFFLTIVLVGWGVIVLLHKFHVISPILAVEKNESIEETPEEIRSIKDIGQWEFLSFAMEEMVERHEASILGARHLVRIYYGTIRMGLDTKDFSDTWFTAKGKTAVLNLPDVMILDDNFIDEARTKTFYEEGAFNAEVKQELYDEAHRAMKARAMSAQNRKTARLAAERQLKAILSAFGYDSISVNFPQPHKKDLLPK